MKKIELMQELLNMYERVEDANLHKSTKVIVDSYIRKLELMLIEELKGE